MSDAKWWFRQSVAEVAQLKVGTAAGIDSVTKMMIAAYKQYDDIEVLLQFLEDNKIDVPPESVAIINRHQKNKDAQPTKEVDGVNA